MAVTGWEPATEAEVAMRDALRAQDQQQYFRVLTRVDLLLPVASGPTAGWGTWTSGGRRDALRAQDQQQYFRVLTRVDLLLPVASGPTAGW
ncbi:hypothetical protein DRA43_31435, partial [Micromonospora provocatoris]